MGRTVGRIENKCLTDKELLTHIMARNIRYFPPPFAEEWRIPLDLELFDARSGRVEIPGMAAQCIEDMINEACFN